MGSSILVVDDERFIVELIADVLEDEGYSVDRAFDGAQAVRVINQSRPDLVIADIMMPNVDGLELLDHVQHRPDPIPVVLMSAVRAPRDLNTPFLPKPFDIRDLLAMVEAMTGVGEAAGSAAY
jgi:CheY-like chemotaxis protein